MRDCEPALAARAFSFISGAKHHFVQLLLDTIKPLFDSIQPPLDPLQPLLHPLQPHHQHLILGFESVKRL